MSIQRNHNGALVISELVNGYLVTRTYYGYTLREAKSMFKSQVRNGN